MNATTHKLIPGQTEFDAADLAHMIAAVESQTLAEYAVKFGGLDVPETFLAIYKAEYTGKLKAGLAKAKATGLNITLSQLVGS